MQSDMSKGSYRSEKRIDLVSGEGVRYVVPRYIHSENADDKLKIRFRVGGVFQNCYISTYFDRECITRKKRPVVAPGEMEEIKLSKERLNKYPALRQITIKVEKGQ